jgi:hypothetical protein
LRKSKNIKILISLKIGKTSSSLCEIDCKNTLKMLRNEITSQIALEFAASLEINSASVEVVKFVLEMWVFIGSVGVLIESEIGLGFKFEFKMEFDVEFGVEMGFLCLLCSDSSYLAIGEDKSVWKYKIKLFWKN